MTPGFGGLESVVLLRGHAVREAKSDQDVEEQVDRGVGNREHDPAAWREKRETGSREALGIVDVFEDGERRDAIEPLRLGVQFSRKAARLQLETVRLQGLDRGVDPDGVLDAGKRPIDEAAIETSDVEEAIAGPDMGERHPDSPRLEKAVEGLHDVGGSRRRVMPSIL